MTCSQVLLMLTLYFLIKSIHLVYIYLLCTSIILVLVSIFVCILVNNFIVFLDIINVTIDRII